MVLSGKRGFGGAAPDYRAEVSEVHKQLIGSVKHSTLSLATAASPLGRGSAPCRRQPSAAGSGGSGAAAPDNRTKPFAGEAERSGKRGYCAASNEALPVQQRLKTLHKVYTIAFAFSAAHIKRCTARSAA